MRYHIIYIYIDLQPPTTTRRRRRWRRRRWRRRQCNNSDSRPRDHLSLVRSVPRRQTNGSGDEPGIVVARVVQLSSPASRVVSDRLLPDGANFRTFFSCTHTHTQRHYNIILSSALYPRNHRDNNDNGIVIKPQSPPPPPPEWVFDGYDIRYGATTVLWCTYLYVVISTTVVKCILYVHVLRVYRVFPSRHENDKLFYTTYSILKISVLYIGTLFLGYCSNGRLRAAGLQKW